jgi:hypothetical protein
VQQPSADSPPLGGSPDGTGRVRSGISVVSSSHLRGISDTSVSTEGAYATPGEGLNIASAPKSEPIPTALGHSSRPNVVSPLTPPQPVHESGDYLGAGLAPSPSPTPNSSNRKSQFSEKLDEVDHEK